MSINEPIELFHDRWTMTKFLESMGSKQVIADPEYQRRVVWDDKKKDELLKSIALNYPIGTISMIRIDNTYEVLDGQQRLTSIRDWFDGKHDYSGGVQKKSNDEYISDDYDDSDDDTSEYRGHVTDTLENLDRYSTSERLRNHARDDFERIKNYIIPVAIIDCDQMKMDKSEARAIAINAFTRMNVNLEKLNNVEVWNAQYAHHDLMKYAREISSELENYITPILGVNVSRNLSHFFEKFVGFKEKQQRRMVDYRLILEYLVLSINNGNPSHRREDLERLFIENMKVPIKHKNVVLDRLIALYERLSTKNGSSLSVLVAGGVSRTDHILYNLMSIYLESSNTIRYKANDLAWDNFRKSLRAFTEQILQYSRLNARDIEDNNHGFKGEVIIFAETFKGQINSKANRDIRKQIMKDLLEDCMSFEKRKEFTQTTKDLAFCKADDVENEPFMKYCSFGEFCCNAIEGDPIKHEDNKDVGAAQTWEIDHIINDADGGDNSINNAHLVCKECNQPKKKEEIMEKIRNADPKNRIRKRIYKLPSKV